MNVGEMKRANKNAEHGWLQNQNTINHLSALHRSSGLNYSCVRRFIIGTLLTYLLIRGLSFQSLEDLRPKFLPKRGMETLLRFGHTLCIRGESSRDCEY